MRVHPSVGSAFAGWPGWDPAADGGALLDALQRDLPVGHMAFDLEGRYLLINEAMVAMNGGTREERVGRPISEVQPDLAGSIMSAIAQVTSSGRPLLGQRILGELSARPGDRRTWRVSYYPLRRGDGTLFGVGAVCEDITEADQAAHHVDVMGTVTAALLPAITLDAVGTVVLGTVLPRLGAEATGLALAMVEGDTQLAQLDAVGTLSWEPADPDPGAVHTQVMDTRMPVWIPGPAGEPDRADQRTWAWAGLPLVTQDGVVGALILGFSSGHPASQAERSLLTAVADQCAIAVERALFFERAEGAAGFTLRLQQATAALARASSEEQIAAAVLGAARHGLGATGGGLGLVDLRRRIHRFVATFGWDQLAMANILGERPLGSPTLSSAAIRTGRPVYVSKPEELLAYMPPERADVVTAASVRQAWVSVPLPGADTAIGTVGLTFPATHRFVAQERAFLESLAGQAAQAIERVRRHQADHQVAVVLQRALLPQRLPTVPGLAVAVRYLAGSGDIEVGGDWYDLFVLEDGEVALSVGDVAGHDLAAAGTMGRLRAQLHACAHAGVDPAWSLSDLDRLVHRADDHEHYLATLVYGIWAPGGSTLSLAVAGHPAPLVLDTTGAHYATIAPGPPLGALPLPALYRTTVLPLDPAGTTLVFFTDGLIERRGESLDTGLERLRAAVRERHHPDPNDLADHLLTSLAPPGGWEDDVALLVCRIGPAAV